MLKLVLFDKDGTLIDKRAMFEPIMKARQEKFNERLLSKVGVLTKQGVKDYMVSEIDKIFKEVRVKGKVKVIKKNAELLKKYSRQGCCIRIITMSDAYQSRLQLEEVGLYKHTYDIIGDINKANDTTTLKTIMKYMKLKPKEILYIGDTDVDEQFARRAKIKFRRA